MSVSLRLRCSINRLYLPTDFVLSDTQVLLFLKHLFCFTPKNVVVVIRYPKIYRLAQLDNCQRAVKKLLKS